MAGKFRDVVGKMVGEGFGRERFGGRPGCGGV